MKLSFPSHGANVAGTYEAFREPLHAEAIDFSVNTNPYGMPQAVQEIIEDSASFISHYPELHSTTLRARIAREEELTPSHVFVGNGAAECIFLLARTFMKRTVGIIEPTFSEYALAATANGSSVKRFVLKDSEALGGEALDVFLQSIDMLYCCHPNNPTGIAYGFEAIQALAEQCKKADTILVIDEAFYDFSVEKLSAVQLLGDHPHVIIVRSFTKMFHIPGIRLGYTLAAPQIIEKLQSFQPPWSVNTLAQQIGLQCLEETSFVTETQRKIAEQRSKLFAAFEEMNYMYSHSAVNYYLLYMNSTQETESFIKYALRSGIVPRHTYNFHSLEGTAVRLTIKDAPENARLLELLQRWRERC